MRLSTYIYFTPDTICFFLSEQPKQELVSKARQVPKILLFMNSLPNENPIFFGKAGVSIKAKKLLKHRRTYESKKRV